MKRINIYITEDTDRQIDALADLLQLTRSEVIRQSIESYSETYEAEIQNFIETQILSNVRAKKCMNVHVFWGIGELKTNLQRILDEHPVECACAHAFAKKVPPLNLDIFALITDGNKFELLILEIKL